MRCHSMSTLLAFHRHREPSHQAFLHLQWWSSGTQDLGSTSTVLSARAQQGAVPVNSTELAFELVSASPRPHVPSKISLVVGQRA